MKMVSVKENIYSLKNEEITNQLVYTVFGSKVANNVYDKVMIVVVDQLSQKVERTVVSWIYGK
jgi:hypothetical protein